MLHDLQESFNYYDKDGAGVISIQLFKNILHNFGFSKQGKREQDEELRRADSDYLKRNCVDLQFCKHVIALKYHKGGSVEEAKECFNIFAGSSKKDQDYITPQ